MRKIIVDESLKSNIKLYKGDIVRIEHCDAYGCISKSYGFVVSQTKKYFTYLCINTFEKEIINNDLNVSIDEEDFIGKYDYRLFDITNTLHIIINQIKTNKNIVISEKVGSLNMSITEDILEKLSNYLFNSFEESQIDLIPSNIGKGSLENKKTLKESNIGSRNKRRESIELTKEAKLDLINNYSAVKKNYYSEKYNIPLNRIAQKVASLRFQYKKKKGSI